MTIARGDGDDRLVVGQPGRPRAGGRPSPRRSPTSAAPPSTPAGTVQFVVDGANLGTPVPVDASGHATSPAVSFPAGTSHTVNAFYVDPAANFVASDTTLSPLTQFVLRGGSPSTGRRSTSSAAARRRTPPPSSRRRQD